MLEYRRLDVGLRAGLTSSPDFFRISEGFDKGPPSSSLSSEVAVSDSVVKDAVRGNMIAVSVDDRECEIFRASRESGVGDVVCDTGSDLPASLCSLAGEPSLLRSIDRTASCNSFQVFRISRPLSSWDASSRSELSGEESGGDITAPVGIRRLFTGGGDWRTLPLEAKSVALVVPPFLDSVGEAGVPSSLTEKDGERRCRWRYDAEE